MTVYVIPYERFDDDEKIAVVFPSLEVKEIFPAMLLTPFETVKVDMVIVDVSINLLKVVATPLFTAIPVA